MDMGCGGVPGLLPKRVVLYPGSPRLGSADPGLNYAALSGLVWLGEIVQDSKWLAGCKLLHHKSIPLCSVAFCETDFGKLILETFGGGLRTSLPTYILGSLHLWCLVLPQSVGWLLNSQHLNHDFGTSVRLSSGKEFGELAALKAKEKGGSLLIPL